MPITPYVWDGTNTWMHVYRPDKVIAPPDTSFTLGTTMPVWKGVGDAANNVGVPSTETLTNYAGTINFASGPQTITNRIITSGQTVVGTGHKFKNCRFVSAYAGDNGGGQVTALSPSVSGLTFERCEFLPSPHGGDRWAGVYGHDFTMTRCLVMKVVDGIDAYNHQANGGAGGRTNIQLLGNWIGYTAWFLDDGYPSRPGGHVDGSHDDHVQHAGGPGGVSIGNFWQGARFNALNPGNVTLDADNLEFTVANGNGVTKLDSSSTNRHPQAHTIYLAQNNVGLAMSDIVFNQNWLWNGGDNGLSIGTVAPQFGSGQYRFATVEAKNNRFGGTWRDWGTNNFCPIRFDTNVILNGRSYLGRVANGTNAASLPNCDGHPEDGNIWIGSSYLGTDAPITYRLDGKPVAQA